MPESAKPFSITLLGNDPGDRQWSMLVYGESLRKALKSALPPQAQVNWVAPDTTHRGSWLRRTRLGRGLCMYWSRHLLYPRLIALKPTGISHILDQGNSWLIRYLDPTRTVITCHDLIPLIFQKETESLFPLFSRKAYQHAISGLEKAAVLAAVSQQTRQDLIRYLQIPGDRIQVVPEGIDPLFEPLSDPAQKALLRKELQLPEGILILHVGQNVFYKNLEGLLRAFEILTRRQESVWLIRAGAYLKEAQRKLAQKMGILDRIREQGPLSREKLRQLYQASDLLVYPSWYEGFGLPPLEAMACGIPVVTSDRGALPETVASAGVKVNPESPEQMAEEIGKLIHDSQLRALLKERGVTRARQFRWETTAQKMLAIYRNLSHVPS